MKDFGIHQTHHERYKDTKKRWYERNREKALAIAKAWREAHPERHKELKKEWARRNRVKVSRAKKAAQWKKLGISNDFSHADYERFLESQGGRCAICDKLPTAKRALAVDHEHLTGRVRGLLCTRCNMGIGYFKTIRHMEYALRYMKANSKGVQSVSKEILEKHGLV